MGLAKKRRYDMTARAAAAAQTRERILRAAFALFRDHLYEDITFARLGEAAGVSPQTVTLHFKTKEGVVKALQQWWAPQEDALRAVPDGDPLEAARRICARYEEMGAATVRWLALEERVPAMKTMLDFARGEHRSWVERTFGARLGRGGARARRLMALVAAYDVYTWHVLRRVLDADETITAMAELAEGVLDRGGRR